MDLLVIGMKTTNATAVLFRKYLHYLTVFYYAYVSRDSMGPTIYNNIYYKYNIHKCNMRKLLRV